MVWNDLNRDGIYTADEPPLAGAQLLLYDEDNHLLGQRVTLGNGRYEFTDLDPGRYRLEEVDPPGYVSSTPNQIVVDIIGGLNLEVYFGDYPAPTPTATPTASPTPTVTPTPTATPTPPNSPLPTPTPSVGHIRVLAWEDVNKNQLWDEDEHAVVGALVLLYRDTNGNGSLDVWESIPIRRAYTQADGSCTFHNIQAGSYIVGEVDKDHYVSSTPNMVSIYIDAGVTGIVYFGDLPLHYSYIPLFVVR